VFVIIDIVVGVLVLAKPSGVISSLAATWCAVRVIIQIADVLVGPSFGLMYAQFADYLFNPSGTNPPNSTGIPGALVDTILILEIMVIWVALKGRSSSGKPSRP
jgi:hypothetical protein